MRKHLRLGETRQHACAGIRLRTKVSKNGQVRRKTMKNQPKFSGMEYAQNWLSLSSSGPERKMNKQQSGFTLVEIAIVLVIIGLLLGGVLKGQELINSAKVKNLANDFRTVPILIYGYQDKFKRLPGDDDGANDSRFSGYKKATATGQTQKSGVIEGLWSSTDLTSENVLFWQHVRGAGLAAGSIDFTSAATASLPTNAEGGMIGIQMTAPMTGLAGTYYLCSQNINVKTAQQLDTTVDDGKSDSGTMRAQATYDASKGGDAAWPTSGTMTVCMAL